MKMILSISERMIIMIVSILTYTNFENLKEGEMI